MRGPSSFRVLTVLLGSCLIAMLLTATAFAAGSPALTVTSPVSESVVTAWNPSVVCAASDPAGLESAGTLTVDGTSYAVWVAFAETGGHWEDDGCESWWVADYDYTRGTLAFAPSMLTDGPHTATLTLRNRLGSVNAVTWSFTVRAAPAISSLTPANGAIAKGPQPVVSAIVNDNGAVATVSVTLDGARVPAVWTASTKTVSATPPSPIADGPHTVSVSATDSGGLAATSAWGFSTVSASSIRFSQLKPAAGSTTTMWNPVISVTCTDSALLTGVTMRLDGATMTPTVKIAPDKHTATATVQPASIADGTHTILVTAVDHLGFSSSETWDFTVAAAPRFSGPMPADGGWSSTLTPLPAVIVAENGTVASWTMLVDGAPVPSAYSSADKSIRATGLIPLTDDSAHTVSVRATDAAGIGAAYQWTFRTHTAPPVFGAPSPAAGSAVAASSQSIALPVSDAMGLAAMPSMTLDDAPVGCWMDFVDTGGQWYDDGCESWYEPAYDYTRGTVRFNASGLSNGTHAVNVRVANAIGASATYSWSFTISTPPQLSVPSPAEGSWITSTQPVISAKVAANSAITAAAVTIDGVAAATSYDAATKVVKATPLTQLADGVPHTAVALVTDASGLSGSLTWSFGINSVGPVLSGQAPAAGSRLTVPGSAVGIAASDPSGFSAFTMKLDGVAVPCSWRYVETGGQWVDDDYDVWWEPTYDYTRANISYAATALKDGTHTVEVQAKAKTGLTSTATWSFGVASPPQLSGPSPADGGWATTLTPAISVKASDNGTIAVSTMRVDGVTVPVSFDAVTRTIRGVPTAPLADGASHTVVVTATDDSGNASTTQWSFTTRTAAPTFSTPAPAPGAATSSYRPSISVVVGDAGGLGTTPSMTLDGANVPCTFAYVETGGQWVDDGCESWWEPTYDYTKATITHMPSADLSNATHTVSVEAANKIGAKAVYAWDFSVHAAPVLSSPSPANGSSVATQSPVITAVVKANAPIAAATAVLDGSSAAAVYDAATKLVKVVPLAPLANESAHTVTVTVRDTGGLSSTLAWGFKTDFTPPVIGTTVPASGTTLAAANPRLAVDASDWSGMAGTQTMKLDGVTVPAGWTFAEPTPGEYDYTRGTFAYQPSKLGDGPHAVTARLTNSAGLSVETSWTFTVATPPVVSAPTPADGSWVGTLTPLITAKVSENSTVSATSISVDGAQIPSSYDPVAKTVSGRPTASLADDATHTAVVTATDAAGASGSLTWTFSTHAGGPVLSGASPATSTAVWNPAIRVDADDVSGLNGAATVRIDGAVVPASFAYKVISEQWVGDGCDSWLEQVLDYTHATISYQPAKLADGTHAVSVEVRNNAGTARTVAWDFTVRALPKVSDPKPAAGSLVTTLGPAISLAVAENGPVATVTATLDGTTVPAVYDAATSRVKVLPGAPLANDVDHRVAVHVVDGAGLAADLEWTFHIQIFQPMGTSMGCADCHPSVPHPTDNCQPCHGAEDCGGSGCHGGHGTLYFSPAECAGCHNTNGVGHGDVTAVHVTSRDMTSCRPCHVASLTTEHERRLEASGAVMTCASCHKSTDTSVTAAIAAGVSECGACHEIGAGSHLEQHAEVPLAAECLTCHKPNVVTEHLSNPRTQTAALTCDTCHSSTDAGVIAAIGGDTTACAACHTEAHGDLTPVHTPTDVASLSCAGAGCHDSGGALALHAARPEGECAVCHANPTKGDLTAGKITAACSGCHAASGVDYHRNMSVHITAPTTYETCGRCHHAWGSNPVRGHDVTRHADGCRTCHDGVLDTASLTTDCGQCHKVEGADYHEATVSWHSPSDEGSLECAGCHETTDVQVVHAEVGCESCHATYSCTECHSLHGGQPGTALLTGTSCSNCHASAGTDYHRSFDASHTFSTMDAGCQSADCHSNGLVAAHASSVGTGSPNPQYDDTCALCHRNTDPDRIPASATSDCSSCHTIHQDVATMHTPTSAGATACAGCHKTTNVLTLHEGRSEGKCAVCHANPTKGDLAAGKDSADCAGCHAAEGTDFHAGQAVAHASQTSTACFGTGCHDASRSLPAVHALYAGPQSENPDYSTTCALCHQNADPARIDWATVSGRCTSCHAGATHSLYNQLHTPTAASATCTDCHGSDITGIHGAYADLTKCAWCHSSATNWSKTADCGGCHDGHAEAHVADGLPSTVRMFNPGVHTGTRSSDVPMDCGLCHEVGDIADIHANNCALCHPSPRDSFVSWTGGCQQGGCHTTYHLEANAGHKTAVNDCETSCHEGTDYTRVSAATCGNCHQLVDHEAPRTTSDAKTSYVGPATVRFSTLDFPDPGGSGVARTYWRLDGSEATVGLAAIAPQSAAGNVEHTLEFWSVDVEGNAEATNSVRFVVTPDTLAPVSSSDAKAEYYGGAATIALRATDNGSSPPVTCYSLDGGPATTGAVVNVVAAGGHTLAYWAEDAAGNVEPQHIVTFTVSSTGERVPPVTQSNAVASYSGTATISLTAMDSGSGVAATYWRLDGGSATAGTSILVGSPGNHVLEFWSVDREGNEELPHKTVSFSVSFPSATGLIKFVWQNPPAGAWTYYYVYVYDASNRLVATAYNTTGCYDVYVPVSATPYKLKAYWFDPAYEEEQGPMWSEGQALIDTPGKIVTWAY